MKSKDPVCEICNDLVPYSKPLDHTERLCNECYARIGINTRNRTITPLKASGTPMNRKYACKEYQESHDRTWSLQRQARWNETAKELASKLVSKCNGVNYKKP